MEHLIVCTTHSQPTRYDQGADWPLLSETDLVRTRPDIHMQMIDGSDRAQARCSLWWSSVPSIPGWRIGLIGHYASNNDAAAGALLRHAMRQLRSQGCTLAIGPIDGSTWERYRFVTGRSPEPVFFLEPDQPDAWPEQFRAQGFRTFARYCSAMCDDLSQRSAHVKARQAQLAACGVVLRPFNSNDPTSDLRAIYRLSLKSFRHNVLHTPISETAFLQQYQEIVPYVVPELTLLAEHEGRLAGYIFSVPNYNQTARGEPLDTLIIKTVAILLERQYGGLGAVLVEEVQLRAAARGHRRAIHALMHEDNRSRTLSQHYKATPIRSYALFARELEALRE